MNNKEFTNQELKIIIYNLHVNNNIIINDELKKNLNQSFKIQYKKLIKYYYDIKNSLVEDIINDKKDDDIIITPIINSIINPIINVTENDKNKIINDLKTENFNQRQLICNLKNKIYNLKTEYKKNKNKNKNNNEINSQVSSTDDEEPKEKRKYNYQELTELSSYNIINELTKLSKHNLKQLYNKYFLNILNRQISNNN